MILKMIEDQNLQAGSRLPTSIELVELSGFSLISVRRALDELERAGRVERQQGVGTFVARKRIVSDPARTGDLLDTLAAGRDDVDFKTKLVSIKIGMPSPIIASSLRDPRSGKSFVFGCSMANRLSRRLRFCHSNLFQLLMKIGWLTANLSTAFWQSIMVSSMTMKSNTSR
jgi:hypothetical protein